MDEWTDRTADLMCLSDVHRWGVIKTGYRQSVAEHSHRVAVIVMELCARLDRMDHDTAPDIYVKCLEWALIHDAPEVLTGDIDGKFKRDYPAVRSAVVVAEDQAFPWYRKYAMDVPPLVNIIVKLADKLEAIDFIKVWGIGARADDVYRELCTILWGEQVPKAARVLQITTDELAGIVRHILHHSVNEANNIQMRRHRAAVP